MQLNPTPSIKRPIGLVFAQLKAIGTTVWKIISGTAGRSGREVADHQTTTTKAALSLRLLAEKPTLQEYFELVEKLNTATDRIFMWGDHNVIDPFDPERKPDPDLGLKDYKLTADQYKYMARARYALQSFCDELKIALRTKKETEAYEERKRRLLERAGRSD